MDITKSQISAALALLDITQAELAENTGVSKPTVSNFLKASSGWETKHSTKQKIITFLRSRGIEFTEDEGIKKSPLITTLSDRDGFRYFMDDVHKIASTAGGNICIFNARPSNWIKWLGEEWFQEHSKRMEKAYKNNRFSFIVILVKNKTFLTRSPQAPGMLRAKPASQSLGTICN